MTAGKARAMPRNIVETVLGAAVLAVAHRLPGLGLWPQSDAGDPGGYKLRAKFDRVDGLDTRRRRADLAASRSARWSARSSIPQTYRAQVTFSVRDGIELPADSSAAVVSSGLLGGKYLSLVPGGDDRLLKDGDEITLTQSSINLEDLIGRYIFSGQGETARAQCSTGPARSVSSWPRRRWRLRRAGAAPARRATGRCSPIWSRCCRGWTRSPPGRPCIACAGRAPRSPSARCASPPRACLETPPTEPPESAAFLEISVADPGSAAKTGVQRLDVRLEPGGLGARAPGLRRLGGRLRRAAGARAGGAGARPAPGRSPEAAPADG